VGAVSLLVGCSPPPLFLSFRHGVHNHVMVRSLYFSFLPRHQRICRRASKRRKTSSAQNAPGFLFFFFLFPCLTPLESPIARGAGDPYLLFLFPPGIRLSGMPECGRENRSQHFVLFSSLRRREEAPSFFSFLHGRHPYSNE